MYVIAKYTKKSACNLLLKKLWIITSNKIIWGEIISKFIACLLLTKILLFKNPNNIKSQSFPLTIIHFRVSWFHSAATLQKWDVYAWWNDLAKCFKICHILYTQKLFNFVLLYFFPYGYSLGKKISSTKWKMEKATLGFRIHI